MIQLSLPFGQRFILYPREIDVLRGVVDGLTDEQIAAKLGICRVTVTRYKQSIREKLGCPTMVSAAVKADRIGLIGGDIRGIND